MNTATDPIVGPLLNSGLALLLPLVVYGLQLLKGYLEPDDKPNVPRWVWVVAMAAVAVGTALANKQFDKGPPTTLTEIWYVQGLVFFVGMLGFHVVNQKVYGPSASAPSVPPPSTNVAPFILAGLLFASAASAAENPPRFSLERVSVGAGAGVHAYGDPAVGDIEAHGVLSYRATKDFGLHANPEFGFGRSNGILRTGGHLTIFRGEPWRCAIGYDFISHFGGARSEFNGDGHGPFAIASRKLGKGYAGQVLVSEDFKNGATVRLDLMRGF